MISKKMLVTIGVVILIVINLIILTKINKRQKPSTSIGRFAIYFIGPLQSVTTSSIHFVKDIWGHYFLLINVSKENDKLRKKLGILIEKNSRIKEIELENHRLRRLLDFKDSSTDRILAAKVTGRDTSPWFQTIIIDKGKVDGVKPNLPVVVSEGIVGQTTEVATYHTKVLLIQDRNSAVDALIQRTRARGLLKGESAEFCRFDYGLQKSDIKTDDIVVSSGLDGLYPKGLRIGIVSKVIKPNAGIFQEVIVNPYVVFEKLEEVFIIIKASGNKVNIE